MLWLPDGYTMTHWNVWAIQIRLPSSTLESIAMTSYYKTMATRRHCEGFTTSCCILRPSGSFVYPSCCHREAKNSKWHRWSHDDDTIWQDALPMHSRWHYEGQNGHTNLTRRWTIGRCFGKSLACQRFCHRSRSCCRSLKNSTGSHTMAQDGLPNAPMSTLT